MWKKVVGLLNVLCTALIALSIGYGFYSWHDFKAHPSLYVAQSAPWYTGPVLWGIVMAIVVMVAAIMKWIIRKKA